MDKIIIRELKLETIIGLFPWERHLRQTLLIDLAIGTDIQQAAATDDLHHTIDYDDVCTQLAAIADRGKFKLIESLAENIAQFILSTYAAPWVNVEVYKLDALTQCKQVGVSIERRQPHKTIEQKAVN
ncbi:MAG: dihydroneopterin aldolase [Cellvibrionaceae bacterium]|nr:dihydroneopterin aldolase [Cellvibrionaceae bacterium]